MVRAILLLSCTAIALSAMAQPGADAPLKNWFDDPFFQVRSALPSCPAPLGPLMTEAQRREESHSRVERGTSCWLEGKCAQPNAYWYDAPLAAAIAQRFSHTAEFDDASIWITVQRRFVIVQGCVSSTEQAGRIGAFIQAVPDVDRVILQLMSGVRGKPPYVPVAPH